ncbi:MAG: prepilin peptidase [Gammaproteobacteria bacterium]|nr:prepilin peptidase [Gammaproteobacteria bacterium]
MDALELLHRSLPALLGVTATLGLLVGSFLNVVILRLPVIMERQWHRHCRELQAKPGETLADDPPFNLVTPRSHCPQCKMPLKTWHNIPLLSYLALQGRCAHCQARIPLRYPLIEGVTAVLSVTVAWHLGFSWQLLWALPLTWSLIALSVIDFDHQLLPDSITLPLLWLGLLLSLFGIFTEPDEAIIGAAAGYLSLWTIYQLFKLVTGKEGMGHGDFKLLAMLGAWLGWQSLLPIALLSSAVGAVVGITLVLTLGRDRQLPIPFGPYLACAGWLYLLWGDTLRALYLPQ